MRLKITTTHLLNFILLAVLLPACGQATPTIPGSLPGTATLPLQATSISVSQVPPTPTPTLEPPTPTPVPLAASINGEGLPLSEYQSELERYAASKGQTGTNLATEDQQHVLDELIDQVLLAQGAAGAGYTLDPAALQERLVKLTADAGGEPALDQWLQANHYTKEAFQTALARSIAAAWMRDKIAAGVPETADQVHARQILLYNEGEASQIYASLQNGADFDTLAWQVDPVSGGELGWFPQGYLLEPDLEKAAFALQPGSYSQVISTRLGFHILQVVERDSAHPLDPAARLALQTQAVRQWLDQRRQQSTIEVATH